MNRLAFSAFALLITGCARHQAPAVATLPTATPIVVPVPAMPTQITPTPDAEEAQRRAVVTRELARLKNASPERDFANAWANKDTRFVGIRGFTIELPGVPQQREFDLKERYGVNPVEGTSDVIDPPEIARLNAVATRYATRYNQILLRKLDEQQNAKN